MGETEVTEGAYRRPIPATESYRNGRKPESIVLSSSGTITGALYAALHRRHKGLDD